MKEQVGNVVLNYEFYKGVDDYSDGDIEDVLLDLVTNEEDVIEILRNDDRWPILYHLSPVRQNILEWYPFKEGASILEVGAGCGAITGVLCKKAKQVVCNDLSKRRSLINANRNKQFDNLEIMVGNFNDVIFEQKFDYITLIGVLEYANYYTAGDNPFQSFLENIKKLLKPGGTVLIAIENKFGLKYWAGAREDHTGQYFDSLEGYHNADGKVRTFAKGELSQMVADAGYNNVEFYYPFPDYKFPQQIFSDGNLPKAEDLICSQVTFDNSRMCLFDETMVFGELLKENQFPFFSNSFFVEAKID